MVVGDVEVVVEHGEDGDPALWVIEDPVLRHIRVAAPGEKNAVALRRPLEGESGSIDVPVVMDQVAHHRHVVEGREQFAVQRVGCDPRTLWRKVELTI